MNRTNRQVNRNSSRDSFEESFWAEGDNELLPCRVDDEVFVRIKEALDGREGAVTPLLWRFFDVCVEDDYVSSHPDELREVSEFALDMVGVMIGV